MSRHEIMHELSQLSAAERILLVQDLWDTVAEDPAAWELSPEQKELLDQRLEPYRARQARGEAKEASWDEVKQRVRH